MGIMTLRLQICLCAAFTLLETWCIEQAKYCTSYLTLRAKMLQVVPRLLDASVLESKKAKIASSGARHNAILTGKT